MSIFDRFENAVERGLNGAFSRVFRSGIKPVDITSGIRKAMDSGISEVTVDRTVAPNAFVVHLSPQDMAGLGADFSVLAEEFAQESTAHAEDNGYILLGPVTVELVANDYTPAGRLEVEASSVRGAVAPATNIAPSPEHPIIELEGHKWLLTQPVTVLGRGTEADVIVDDSGVSRQHLELRITPNGVIATDLGSTNGTWVEGHRVDAATLVDGNQLTIGRTRILFWTHAAPEGGVQ
ncbi:MAG: DUF3662 and FHA domain-containing protein [Actinomycetaceae bacterium]|nr:DUF3662 and FHA domain-containing protein [Actinomycetaceae bacterium]